MTKAILVATSHYAKPIEDRIDRDFTARRNPNRGLLTQQELLSAAEGADARRKIPIAYTPGVNHEATADIAMLLLLGASRRAWEAQELVPTGAWRPLSPDMLLGWQLGGKVLGIFGMGRVGQALARRARGFGVKIHYCNASQLPAEIAGDTVYHKNPSDLLRASQYLSLHAPETPETHHFLF
jgi:lactate dehydrogenase-like 2-hydroxyacid dehydrogenase